MKPWIKRALIGIFGASVLFGGLAACSHRGGTRHGWQSMSEEDAAKMKAKMVDRVGSKLDLDETPKEQFLLFRAASFSLSWFSYIMTTPPENRPYSAEMFPVRTVCSWIASSMKRLWIWLRTFSLISAPLTR